MSPEQAATTDPRALVQSLNSGAIRARLVEIESEAEALRVLLRAARARERTLSAGRSRRESEPCRS
jgi:hypothetical protein